MFYTYDANGNITKITEGVGEDAPVIAEYAQPDEEAQRRTVKIKIHEAPSERKVPHFYCFRKTTGCAKFRRSGKPSKKP